MRHAARNAFSVARGVTGGDAKVAAVEVDAAQRDWQDEETHIEELGHGGESAQAVLQLRSDMNSLLAEQVRRDEVRDWFIKEGMFVRENAPERDGVFDRFHFRAEGFEFQGRTDEIEAVERDFLTPVDVNNQAERFRWMALCGPGGTGKSRLAQRIVDLQRASGTFSCAGFATTETLSRTDFVEELGNRLPAPTLIVIDYAFAAAADLPAFMRRMAAGTGLLTQPVRVIVVVRRPDDRVLSDIAEPPRGGNDFGLKRLEVIPVASASETYSKGGGRARITLEPLGDDDTVAIMRERMRAAAESGAVRAEFDDPKGLLSLLRRFDERMRPLFACVVADALQRGQLPEFDMDGSQEEARKTLFTAYMKEESLRVWHKRAQLIAPKEPDECVVRHVNLARVVTCAGGAKRSDLRDSLHGKLDSDTQEALPGLGRQDGGANIYRRLLSSIMPVSDDDEIAPVQPDLIAECLLLADGKSHGSFTRPGEQGDATNLWLSPHQVIELAWQVDPSHSAAFIRLAAQDFPMTVHNTRCLPAAYNDVEAARAGARALRNICADIAADVLPRLPTEDQMVRLFDIAQAFDGSLVEWASRDAQVYEYYGDTLFQVSQIAAFVLNGNTSLADAITVVGEIETANDNEVRGIRLSSAFERGQTTQSIAMLADPSNALDDTLNKSTVDETTKSAPKSLIDIILERYPKLVDRAEPFVWDSQPFAKRERYVRALSNYYGAVLWEDRDKLQLGGRAYDAPSVNELSARRLARDTVLSRLTADPSFDDVATIALLLHALLYAENASLSSAYQDALARVVQAVERTEVTLRGVVVILKFAYNQLVADGILASQRTPEGLTDLERSNILANLEAADTLLRIEEDYVALSIDMPGDSEMGRCVSALIDLHWARTSQALFDILPTTNFSEEVPRIIERFGGDISLGSTVLNGIANALLSAGDVSTHMSDLIERHLTDWLDKGAIDAESFRPPSIDIELALVCLVVGTAEKPPVLTENTAHRLLKCLGAEARSATLRAVIDISNRVSGDLRPRSSEKMIKALRHIYDEIGLSGDDRLPEAFLSLWGRQLLDGESETFVSDIEPFWSNGVDPESVRGRALAMRAYALLGAMSIDPPPELNRLRDRLTSSDLEIGSAGSVMSVERNLARMHDEARAEALASLGDLAIRRGGDPLEWSVTGRNNQKNKGSEI